MDKPTGKREAAREANRRWRAANPEAAREAARRHYAANREAIREAERQRYAANREANREAARKRYAANREARREAERRQRKANRDAVLDHYGHECACCGSVENLTIDHVNGDGAEHRKQIGHGSVRLYRWLIVNGFPDGFAVLCRLCNKSKGDGDRCRLDHQTAEAA